MYNWYSFCRSFCRSVLCPLFFGRALNGRRVPSTGPVLLISNHQSFFDPAIVGYGLSREVDYMARDTLFRHPLFGPLIRSVNAFPVKLGGLDISAIKETFRRLKAGRAVLLFPEGTRSPDGRIRQFKPGLALLARKANVPVVPVVIDGAFEAWPRKALFPRPLVTIHAAFAEPIYPDQFAKYEPDEFVRILHQTMIGLQSRMRSHVGREPYDYSAPVDTDDMDR